MCENVCFHGDREHGERIGRGWDQLPGRGVPATEPGGETTQGRGEAGTAGIQNILLSRFVLFCFILFKFRHYLSAGNAAPLFHLIWNANKHSHNIYLHYLATELFGLKIKPWARQKYSWPIEPSSLSCWRWQILLLLSIIIIIVVITSSGGGILIECYLWNFLLAAEPTV